MNVWVDSLSDMRLSINDLYMIFLMTGWMLLFMGLYYKYTPGILFGAILAIVCIYGIRTQLFVTESQFLLGMIPHHSMAVHMSRKMEKKPNGIEPLLKSILTSQQKEIEYMKQKLAENKL